MEHPAPFVWIDRRGAGRHVNAYFRLDFRLTDAPRKAVLNLFADSRYHLKINGTFVGYGPARFFPSEPEYDSYDIAPHLHRGQNVVAVQVVAHGMSTFQQPMNRPGFVAWGEVRPARGRAISLSTPGKWKCLKARGYDQTAPKFSFTSSAIDVFDARRDPPDWALPGAKLSGWKDPVEVTWQDAWGRLRPRSIPHLTQETRLPKTLLGVYALSDAEEIVSFRVPCDDSTRAPGRRQRCFGYTFIHSPRAQKVRVGLHWGEHYLNGGRLLRKHTPREDQLNRNDITLNLRKGWNEFFIKYDMIGGPWDFHMALPRDARLHLSSERKRNSRNIFMTAGPFTDDEEPRVREIKLPLASPDALPDLSVGWKPQPRRGSANNPAWEMAWRDPAEPKAHEPARVGDLTLEGGEDTALVFDMGGERLGRIFVDFEAPRGTHIDVGYAEDLHHGRPWVLKRNQIFAGERHIARGGVGRLETFKPRGLRYLQVNVTGATSPVRIERVGMVEQVYPLEKVGQFECSDPMLNEIWEMGWRALRMCSEDSYTDCPWRERGLYAGDMLPELAITLATSGDARLAKRCLKLFQHVYGRLMGHPQPHRMGTENLRENQVGDFPLITLVILGWYVEHTGDLAFARKLYRPYCNMMERVLACREADGLLFEQWVFIDWVPMEKTCRNTALHAAACGALETLSRLAERLGSKKDQHRYAEAASGLAAAMRKTFWDSGVGAYRDGTKGGKPIDSHFLCSSAWPSVFGLTTDAQERHLREYFDRTLDDLGSEAKQMLTSPYGAFYVLGALYRNGNVDLAERFMRGAWSRMVLAGADTTWEHFSDSDSQCHAWSGSPTFYLSTQMLGVDLGWPVSSDPSRVRIAPASETVEWARGVVAHPAGPVRVAWRIEGERLIVDCDVPDQVRWSVEPQGRLANKQLWVNGRRRS
jgi:alpha-L-rhamnosidase